MHVYVGFSLDFWGKVWYNDGQLGKRDSYVLPETVTLGGASSAPPLVGNQGVDSLGEESGQHPSGAPERPYASS